MRWLLRNLWFPPVAFALLVLASGLTAHRMVQNRLRETLANALSTVRDSSMGALSDWISSQERAARGGASDSVTRSAALALIERAEAADSRALRT